MVTPALAGKWTPAGIAQRLRVLLRQRGDLALALRIGHFVWSAPADLGDASLPAFLDRLRAAPRPPAPDLRAAVERIARLRQPWLRLAVFGDRNMCYVRALTLYRFLDPGAAALRIHFGVEPGRAAGDRLRGHAWISVGDEIFEVPDPVRAGRVREIYRHPPVTPTDAPRGGG